MADAPTKPDYRPTVFLPKTDFPMKAGLPQKEPAILARWLEQDLHGQLRASREGREKFILHDGPPYANGDIHIGHALNHILKDMVVRTQTLLGKDAPYVPGWDCHGLPIEWKVEEQYRKKKLNKDEVPVKEFRAECRAYAQHWVDVQREQLKRLGIGGQWDKPYLTMDFGAEATIVAELMKFAESGQLYRGAKPVMWSPVEKTALAEAEIEYEDIVSTQIDVAFEIVESPVEELVGAYAVIWTTTPWTIPVNQAIGLRAGHRVCRVVRRFDRDAGRSFGERPCSIGKELLAAPSRRTSNSRILTDGIHWYRRVRFDVKGTGLAGTVARHPMHHLGGFFAKPRPFMAADFVTTDQGTGLVHEAPDHGEEDFYLCQANGIDPVFAVTGEGKYREDWLWLGGQGSVINNKFNAPDGPICTDLREAGALLAASADFQHSYPHSWRSKAKVIYRCTPQWFIAMDRPLSDDACRGFPERRWENEGGALRKERASTSLGTNGESGNSQSSFVPSEVEGRGTTLRSLALKAIADTRFVPEKGRNRIGSMVEGRPDWVISRQRAWGVPIALFVERKTRRAAGRRRGQPPHRRGGPRRGRRCLVAGECGEVPRRRPQPRRLRDADRHPRRLVRQRLHPRVHAGKRQVARAALARRPLPRRLRPAPRLVPVLAARKLRHPRPRALRRGVDPRLHDGRQGHENVQEPRQHHQPARPDEGARRRHPAAVGAVGRHLRGPPHRQGDPRRRVRPVSQAPQHLPLSARRARRFRRGGPRRPGLAARARALHAPPDRRARRQAQAGGRRLRLQQLHAAARDFANNDLSAFYFDIRKDSLYCDVNAASGFELDKRRAYRTVLDIIFHALVRWAAPVLVFTSEEVWGTRYPDAGSVHLLEWPDMCSPAKAGQAGSGLRRETGGRAPRAPHASHRSDRAAPPRQGDRVEPAKPRSRFHPEDDPQLLAELFIVFCSRERPRS